jgi:hypothetical protein
MNPVMETKAEVWVESEDDCSVYDNEFIQGNTEGHKGF